MKIRTVISSSVFAVGLALSAPSHADPVYACAANAGVCTIVELFAAARATGSLTGSGASPPPPLVESAPPLYYVESTGNQPVAGNGAVATNVWVYDFPDCCSGAFALGTSAEAGGSAAMGQLRVSATSTSNMDAGQAVTPVGTFGNPNTTGGNALGAVQWQNYITVTDPDLPFGAPITVSYELNLVGVASDSLGCTQNAELSASVDFAGVSNGLTLSTCQPPPDPVAVTTQVLNDETFSVVANMSAMASSSAFGDSDFEQVSAIGSDTSYFIFNVLTPGASYTTADGTVFLTAFPAEPVSEPSSLAILTVALIGLAGIMKIRPSPRSMAAH